MWQVLLLSLATGFFNGNRAEPSTSTVNRLYNNLMKDYNKYVRPVSHHNNTIDVTLSIGAIRWDLDEKTRRFDLNAYFYQTWTDGRLQWNAPDYDGLSTIPISNEVLWRPDISLYNNYDYGRNFDFRGAVPAFVTSLGVVTDVSPVHLRSECSIDLRYWPFDQQTCVMVFGSWAHNGNELNFTVRANVTNIEIFGESASPWKLINSSITVHHDKYECCEETYPSIHVSMTIARDSYLYRLTVVTPAFVIVLLTMGSFLLPSESDLKITIRFTIFLVLILYLLYFNVALPTINLDGTPLIVYFFSTTALLEGIAIFLALLTNSWVRTSQKTGPPAAVMKVVDLVDGSLCSRLPIRFISMSGTDQPQLLNEQQDVITKEWLRLATTVDRVAFFAYLATFVVIFLQVIAG